MNTPAFTHGPWCVCRIHDKPRLDSTVIRIRIEQTSGDCAAIAIMDGVDAADHANAQLMATGPEMYSALELALPILEQYARIGYGNAADAVEAVTSALAKAREVWP